MGERTKISWTDHTFNPWIGCTKVSDGCKFCYAEKQNTFYQWNRHGWGPQAPRHRTSAANWAKVLTWNNSAKRDGVRRRVFCASLADVCDDHPSIETTWRDDLLTLVRTTEYLDWLFLTKHPENFNRFYDDGDRQDNLWVGVSVENQQQAEKRIPKLLQIRTPVHFLSCEPLLENVDLDLFYSGIDWVIVGGESGPNARRFDPQWAREVRLQCKDAEIPFFFKQNGGNKKIDGAWGGDQLEGCVYHAFPDAGKTP